MKARVLVLMVVKVVEEEEEEEEEEEKAHSRHSYIEQWSAVIGSSQFLSGRPTARSIALMMNTGIKIIVIDALQATVSIRGHQRGAGRTSRR
ncbi:hypothetical protein E2C01_047915 [Portunus trituberculatus]|uniref:Uncharacterized protein n=1 Tax=Portunus trituberculatus TaxID=210409 RepID=A0A5B7G8S0_PORTR|nr:hypothetical protein [Portunus trituberculatus]